MLHSQNRIYTTSSIPISLILKESEQRHNLKRQQERGNLSRSEGTSIQSSTGTLSSRLKNGKQKNTRPFKIDFRVSHVHLGLCIRANSKKQDNEKGA